MVGYISKCVITYPKSVEDMSRHVGDVFEDVRDVSEWFWERFWEKNGFWFLDVKKDQIETAPPQGMFFFFWLPHWLPHFPQNRIFLVTSGYLIDF